MEGKDQPVLPPHLEDQVWRLYELPQVDRERRVAELCAAHPEHRVAIDRLAALLEYALPVHEGGQGPPSIEATATDVRHEQGAVRTGDLVKPTGTDDLMHHLAGSPRLDLVRYSIEDVVGIGGMGKVMRVYDRHLNRRLAMKVPLRHRQPSDGQSRDTQQLLLARFLEEAQVTSQLDHPGVVPVYELGLDDQDRVYFTMRLVRGRSASEIFQLAHAGQEGWTTTRALEVILKVCDTMAYAHEKGVLHRDLKPSNVMVGRFGEVYVMDWGLAKVTGQVDRHDLRIRQEADQASQVDTARKQDAESASGSSVVSIDGQKLGTPSYMAPEQAIGEPLDRRADVYSIGAMLYELLAGVAPYAVSGLRQPAYRILEKVVEGPTKRLEEIKKGVPAELVAIVEKAMQRDREQRYRSTLDVAADLRAYLEHRVVAAYRTGAVAEMRAWVRRNRALAASLAAVFLVAVGAAVGMAVLAGVAQDHAQLVDQRQAQYDQLASLVHLDRARDHEKALHPPWPYKVEEMRRWLDEDWRRVRDAVLPVATALAELRARTPPFGARREESRKAQPRYAELVQLRSRLDALRRAQAVREGGPVVGYTLEAKFADKDAMALNRLAFSLVGPDRTSFGREAEGLALAQRAFDTVTSESLKARILDTLAWAQFRNGMDTEAAASMQAALAANPEDPALGAYARRLRAAIQAVQGEGGRAQITHLEMEVEDLEGSLVAWQWATDADHFLHDALVRVLPELRSFQETAKDVERRLGWAERIDALSRAHPKAKASWDEARAAIAKADGVVASAWYRVRPIDLKPQMGLVPIGVNPVTKLWEFYELRSAWDPDSGQDPAELAIPSAVDYDAEGKLPIEEGTGIVFVLLPGGTFAMGKQGDPLADADENDYEVTLDAFFLARHELTRAQWRRLSGRKHPSFDTLGVRDRNDPDPIGWLHPIENVNWTMCSELLRQHGLVLPTEAQWEYGCRANTTTPWWTGENARSLAGAANLLDRKATTNNPNWGDPEPDLADGWTLRAPVGHYRPSPFGLFDMHGNVREWTRDAGIWLQPPRPGDGLREEGHSSHVCVCRGGSYISGARDARASRRQSEARGNEHPNLGLRAARLITE